MKKFLMIPVFSLLLAGWIPAQQLNIDFVIPRTARAVEEALPQRTRVAVLNFTSPAEAFSDYVIEELTGEFVKGRKVTVVDRQNLSLISREMNLQMSGDVSDDSAQAIGRMLGAQSIVSGSLTSMGTFYRLRVRVINVETAAIQTQFSHDVRNDDRLAFLLRDNPASSQPAPSNGAVTETAATVITAPETTMPSIDGIIVPGAALTEKLAWLQRNAESHNTYVLVANANENIEPQTLEYRGAINITVVLRGDNTNRNIRLRSNGTMWTVKQNVTFFLDGNITLLGHNGNSGSIVRVDGGTFKMNNGSAITGNVTRGEGGEVYVGGRSVFEMNGGTVSGNAASRGGGVFLYSGTFTMSGGNITGNTASQGGGVWVDSGETFNMRNGVISGNTAREYGGGVRVNGTFNKGGGSITGYNSDQNNGNVVRDDAGNILARRGHAAYVSESRRKETTAGPGVNLNSGSVSGWDN